MLILPRLDQVPYDDPQNFVSTWDITMSLIEAMGQAGGSGSSDLLTYFFQSGYLNHTPPQLAPSAALGLYLPEGFQFVHDGQLITLDEDVLASGVTPGFSGWVTLEPEYNPSTDSWTFELEEHDTKPPNGSGLLGYIESDIDGVYSLDFTGDNSDAIPTLPELLEMIRSGTGGAGGGITHVGSAPWSVDDPRPTATVVEEMIQRAIEDAQDGAAVKPMQRQVDILAQELALTRNHLISLIPVLSDVTASSNVLRAIDGIIGDGSNGHPDVIIHSSMNLNEDGDFEP